MIATYNTTMQIDGYSTELLACKIDSGILDYIMRNFKAYKAGKHELNRWDPYKVPTLKWFVRNFIGDENSELEYGNSRYMLPQVFQCASVKTAARLREFLHPLEYHDTFRQEGCSVDVEGKNVFLNYFDY